MTLPPLAIAIRQPWASLIIWGGKDIENRTWPTEYRGPVLIHASKKADPEEAIAAGVLCVERYITLPAVIREQMELLKQGQHLGGIIGVAEIVDCVTTSKSPWFVGDYGFVLANPRPLPFHPQRGLLGFFKHSYPQALWEQLTVAELWTRQNPERLGRVLEQVGQIAAKLHEWGWSTLDKDELDHATIAYSRICTSYECCDWLPFDVMPNWQDDLYCLLLDEDETRWLDYRTTNRCTSELAALIRQERTASMKGQGISEFQNSHTSLLPVSRSPLFP